LRSWIKSRRDREASLGDVFSSFFREEPFGRDEMDFMEVAEMLRGKLWRTVPEEPWLAKEEQDLM
jgi:hypothetical protein